MHEVISRKKNKFKEWQWTKSVETQLTFIKAKRESKRVVSKLMASKYKELCSRLNKKMDKRDI